MKRFFVLLALIASILPSMAQSITVTSSRHVAQGTGNMTVHYEGAPVGTSAWIGIYKSDDPTHVRGSFAYAYTDGESGDLTFDLPGWDAYYAVLFKDGGYDEIARSEWVLACNDYNGAKAEAFTMTTDKETYEVGEPIEVTLDGAPAFGNDWLAIFKADCTNMITHYEAYQYVGGNASGTISFPGTLAAGDYFVTYLLWDGYAEVFRRVPFSVKNADVQVVDAPKADVLDIQFNADGTVEDISGMQNPVTVKGCPEIVKSPMFDMNVLCQAEEQWASKNVSNFVRVDYNDQLVNAVSDGATIELMARPYFEGGKMNNDWVNVFGTYQGGGMGIIIYNGKWDFECVIGGAYKDATYNGGVVNDEWIHLTGVWNKETGDYRLYVNGELTSALTGAMGELSLANGDNPFFGIGVDYEPSNDTHTSNLFQGDIAIARIYDNPLTADEVAALYRKAMSHKTELPEHNEEQEIALRKAEDGNVLIANAEELDAFGHAVRMSNTNLNARLEADIDYTGHNKPLSNLRPYRGTFDGQGHTIKLGMNNNSNNVGLFHSTQDATFKNLNLEGEIRTDGRWAASVVAKTYGNTHLDHISSNVDILGTWDGDASYGGLVSVCESAGLNISNCLFAGSIKGETSCMCAGLVAWASDKAYFNNCLVIADMNEIDPTGCATLVRNSSNAVVKNCYHTEMPFDDITPGGTLVDEDQLASGEVCWKLNCEEPMGTWHQTLEADAHPVLDSTHGTILGTEGEYMCITDEASLHEACASYAEYLRSIASENNVYQPLIDKLLSTIDGIEKAESLEALSSAKKAYNEDMKSIRANEQAYADLEAAVNEALEQIDGFNNVIGIRLRAYLTETNEPSVESPNGTAPYILDNRTLDTEGVKAEITFIHEQVQLTMTSGTPAGTDISVMLAEPDFTNGGNSWEGTKASECAMTPNALQWYGVTKGTKYQTVSGLSEGIYEFDLNAFNMVGDDAYCSFYTASIFAGDMEMPVMAPFEDALELSEAEDGVNCYLKNDKELDGSLLVPYSREGGCIALNYGRYQNRILVKVGEDGTLPVGIRLDGSGRSDDWVEFANAHLIYQGTMDEAEEAIGKVLQNAVDRALTTLEYEGDTYGSNYLIYPNYPAALRNELKSLTEQAATANDAAEKYALLEKFSNTFKKIYEGRIAYRDCAKDIDSYSSCMNDFPDFIDIMLEKSDAAWISWQNGDFSAEEAIACGTGLMAEMDTYIKEMPEPDLMDIVFNEDGTATDVSKTHNEVGTIGRPCVKKSAQLGGMNINCNYGNVWGGDIKDAFYVKVSDEMQVGIDDGLTMELLVRPMWDDDLMESTEWVTVLGNEESGGMGMIVYGKKWDFEVHAGGSYKDAYSNEAPRKGEWVHLLGIWNPANGISQLYVNGELNGSTSASGTYKLPNVAVPYFGIGFDNNGDSSGSNPFQGDFAIVRMYDQPVNGSVAKALYKRAASMIDPDAEEHEDNPDGIQSVKTESAGDDVIYNLSGQRVMHAGKGIYIIGGKKVAIK